MVVSARSRLVLIERREETCRRWVVFLLSHRRNVGIIYDYEVVGEVLSVIYRNGLRYDERLRLK